MEVPRRMSPIKELKKNWQRRLHNLDIKTDLRKTTKKFLASVQSKNSTEAQANLKILYQKIDKAAKRNIFHKNTAARRKSRFARLLASIRN